MKTFYVVGRSFYYGDFLQNARRVNDMADADVVIFTGGEDVTPSLYGHPAHPSTGFNIDRDKEEVGAFEMAAAMNKMLVGICRGSQFLTVMSGGKLFQDVDNHAIVGTHKISLSLSNEWFFPAQRKALDGEYSITSTHHQMMYPWTAPEFEILAVAHPERCSYRVFMGDRVYGDHGEPEIVWYPKTMALCIQGHPEQMHHSMPIIPALNNLIDHYLTLEL